MAAGSYVGGRAGVSAARRLAATALRWGIVILGTAVALVLLVRCGPLRRRGLCLPGRARRRPDVRIACLNLEVVGAGDVLPSWSRAATVRVMGVDDRSAA
jgi:hypothetical protein